MLDEYTFCTMNECVTDAQVVVLEYAGIIPELR